MARHSVKPAGLNLWQRLLVGVLGLVVAATAVGLVWLWPSSGPDTSEDFDRAYSLNQQRVTGTVTQVDSNACASPATGTAFDTPPRTTAAEAAGAHDDSCRRALVDLEDGPDAGKMTQLVHYGVAGEPVLEVGDHITMTLSENPADGQTHYAFADYERSSALWAWGLAIVAAIVIFAAWHGLRSLIGLAFSLAIVFFFLLPAITAGQPIIPVTIVACAAILVVAIPLVHGWNFKSASALAGSLVALAVATVVAIIAIRTSHLQGLSSEDNLKLLLYLPQLSVVGVLLAGFIVGALGGLNDVSIGQASTVHELAAIDPAMPRGRLFVSAMKVGRDHIASMVYTIVLSYTGAALPLLLLISAADASAGQVLSSDVIATELLRSGVGALSLVSAVPVTTLIAAFTHSDPGPRDPNRPPAIHAH